MTGCEHIENAERKVPSEAEKEGAICPECVEAGTKWLHLRMCLECGQIGCCDSSPMQHASRHARKSNHPVITSMEPGERWRYCYLHEIGV